MGLIKWYKDLMARVCSPIGSHPDDDPALRYQPGEKVLCIYGHYEGEIVTVREILPGTKNIPGFIYACEASDGERLTLGPLDVIEAEDDSRYDSYTKEVEDRIMLECRAYRNTTGKVIKKIEVCNLDWGKGKVRLVVEEDKDE